MVLKKVVYKNEEINGLYTSVKTVYVLGILITKRVFVHPDQKKARDLKIFEVIG